MKVNKKIALATAAALAIIGISTSANAAPLSVTVAGVANTTTSAAPATVAVPTSNVIDNSNTIALAATADTGTVVNFSASGVKLVPALNSVSAPVNSTSGSTSYSATSQGSAITIYAFTTSTNVGTVTITNGAYSTVVYIQGLAGAAASVAVSVPSTAGLGTSPNVIVSAKDVFGNPVASEVIAVSLVGTTFSDGSTVKNLTTATKAAAIADTTGATIWGSASYALSPLTANTVTVVATDASIAATSAGLPLAVRSASASIIVLDFVAQIASLTTQLTKANADLAKATADLAKANTDLAAEKAARATDKVASDKALADLQSANKAEIDLLTAQHAATVKSIKDTYNALAKKWNAKNPKSKVALLK